jgi:pimeloyl-ACP methyl ester carboxylesterase
VHRSLLVLVFLTGLGLIVGAPVSVPFDWVWNLGAPFGSPELRCPNDGKVRVVVLQHGMLRAPMSLDRLARSLSSLGYEVLNTGYPSTGDSIEMHADRLHESLQLRLRKGPVDELSFVGHSMGGLVIQEYLRRPDALAPKACVYIATPHRGAMLADKRRHWFLYRWVMGRLAAAQLATTDPFHTQSIPFPDRSGTIIGDIGDGNADIDGPDDGTVGCAEASFTGAADSVRVPYGHTRIVVVEEVILQVAHFLGDGAFSHPPK